MKKIICVLFALLLVVIGTVFSGCAGNTPVETAGNTNTQNVTEQSGDTETSVTTEQVETEALPELPDVKYNKTVRLLVMDRAQDDILTADHMTNDSMHDAVFMRNVKVAERFGVEFDITIDDETNVSLRLSNAVKSGSDEYDIVFTHMVNGANNAMNNDVLPIDELPYVDVTKPWWDKDVNQGFSIKGHLMMINGDISPFGFNCTSCLYFNKRLFDANDLEYPYQLVKEGKWTLDKMIELTKDFTQDKDGDGKISPDGEDIYGLTSWWLGLPYVFYYGAGGMMVSKDADDVPYYSIQTERDTNIYNKIFELTITNKANYEKNNWSTPQVLFMGGRALFFATNLDDAGRLREMDDDFGIIPVPKYDESQKEYKSFVGGHSAMICVPATVKPENREFVSVILEALASEAYTTVTPVLKETYLKRKLTRDADSAEMIDYIVRYRVFDMGYVFLYGGVGSYVREMLASEDTNVASTLKRYSKSAPKQIEKIVEAFEKSLKQ